MGKSTVLRRLLADRQTAVRGFRTVRREKDGVVTVHMLSLPGPDSCREDNCLFRRENGVLFLNPGTFDRIGGEILGKCRDYPLVVMDELGPAEREARGFQQVVRDCLDGDGTVYGVLQQAESDFLEEIRCRSDTLVVEVTEAEREDLPRRLREAGW